MNIAPLITRLLEAREPSRSLDGAIAVALGWKKSQEEVPQGDGTTKTKQIWYLPGTSEIGIVPEWTSNLQAALELWEKYCPGRNVGITWGGGYASAGVLDGRTIERAATPAIALCLIAIVTYVDATRR